MKTALRTLAFCTLLLGCASEPQGVGAAPRPERAASLEHVLARIGLSAAQQRRIEALRRDEGAWLAKLERAHRTAEAALRAAEAERPFDEDHVGMLVRREAEIFGYVRGTESRLVSAILEELEPEQRRAFRELRSSPIPDGGVASAAASTLGSLL